MNATTGLEARALACVERPDWSNEEYHADRSAVSCSPLKKILRSASHLKAYREAENKETNSRLIGNALHAAVLEPELFEQHYVEWRGGDRKGAKYNEFVEMNPGKSILKPEEMSRVLGMCESIMTYTQYPIGKLLKEGVNERSIIWTDPETGVRCKIRPDNVNPFGMMDLKTTDDVRPFAFVRQCVREMYDVQAAMYQEGYLVATGEKRDFYFIGVEDEAPHSVWVHQASPEMLTSGMTKFRKALAEYKKVLETGEYPGYPMPCSIIEWPRYA